LEVANNTLGLCEIALAKEQGLIDASSTFWIVDWPMFEWSEEEGRYMSAPPIHLAEEETAHHLDGELAQACSCL
jgi:aspartyl-tRNA synthetase